MISKYQINIEKTLSKSSGIVKLLISLCNMSLFSFKNAKSPNIIYSNSTVQSIIIIIAFFILVSKLSALPTAD